VSRRPGISTLVFILSIAIAVSLDQVLKAVVVKTMLPGQTVTVVPHVLWLTYSTNSGAAFGMLRGSGQLIFLSSLILVMLMLAWFFWSRKRMGMLAFVGLGLVIGGAVGNLADRVFRGEVVDFIDLGWWPIFNIADMAILAGAIIVLIVYTRELWREGNLPDP
jgi:signal peptidase II